MGQILQKKIVVKTRSYNAIFRILILNRNNYSVYATNTMKMIDLKYFENSSVNLLYYFVCINTYYIYYPKKISRYLL